MFFSFIFYFRIRITDALEYSSNVEGNEDGVVETEPPITQKKKPILMAKVENVLHEPFKLTEEVKVHIYSTHNTLWDFYIDLKLVYSECYY